MASTVTAPLGSYENPRPYIIDENRIIGDYYFGRKGDIRKCCGIKKKMLRRDRRKKPISPKTSLNHKKELGTKENPHPYKRGEKDRIKDDWYITFRGDIKLWNGKRLYDVEPEKKRKKEWRKNNKEKKRETDKKYRENNKEKIKKINKEWRKNNKEKKRETDKKYYNKNRGTILKRIRENRKNNIEQERKKARKRYQDNKVEFLARSRLNEALKSQNAYKNERTMEYYSASVKHIHQHLESQFEPGMTWENHGFGDDKWNIEHRRPCDSFDLNNEDQIYMCFHWTNLQPMWQPENLAKSNSFDPKTFRYKWWGVEIGWMGIPNYLMNN